MALSASGKRVHHITTHYTYVEACERQDMIMVNRPTEPSLHDWGRPVQILYIQKGVRATFIYIVRMPTNVGNSPSRQNNYLFTLK